MEELDDLIKMAETAHDTDFSGSDTLSSPQFYNPETSEQDWDQAQVEKAETESEISGLYEKMVQQGIIQPPEIPENPELFIGNIDVGLEEVLIKRFLQKYGNLTKFTMKQKGISRFCFVTFENDYSAYNLHFDIKNYNVTLGNRRLIGNWNLK